MGKPAPDRSHGDGAAEDAVEPSPAPHETIGELSHEQPREEPYRPELVARLERAVREGRYQPDPVAIADALVDKLDSL